MAIRLRTVDGVRVALCAAETDPMPGDVYLDDADHYALAAKYAQDWAGETITWSYPEIWAAMESQKRRDAQEMHRLWMASCRPVPMWLRLYWFALSPFTRRSEYFAEGPKQRHIWRSVWTVLHDVIAHPIAGVFWILGAKRAGDWLHEATLPPMAWNDLDYFKKLGAPETENPQREGALS